MKSKWIRRFLEQNQRKENYEVRKDHLAEIKL